MRVTNKRLITLPFANDCRATDIVANILIGRYLGNCYAYGPTRAPRSPGPSPNASRRDASTIFLLALNRLLKNSVRSRCVRKLIAGKENWHTFGLALGRQAPQKRGGPTSSRCDSAQRSLPTSFKPQATRQATQRRSEWTTEPSEQRQGRSTEQPDTCAGRGRAPELVLRKLDQLNPWQCFQSVLIAVGRHADDSGQPLRTG